ncbi:hypothetical protein HLH89_32370 [Rhizobium laguerreae]|uniref:hypothetical protein n=1 Tax=Rhizobium laguerreae TaxID=1076926 RepID=UPI001479450C|nr:hypothetical protein [Rhizobium laguerreae]NNH85654.1 hypothetical protein [Rhizobium laguerreae]
MIEPLNVCHLRSNSADLLFESRTILRPTEHLVTFADELREVDQRVAAPSHVLNKSAVRANSTDCETPSETAISEKLAKHNIYSGNIHIWALEFAQSGYTILPLLPASSVVYMAAQSINRKRNKSLDPVKTAAQLDVST